MTDLRSEDLIAVRDQARRLLREQVRAETIEALLDTPGGCDLALWRLVGGQGWPAVGLTEDQGGAGLGLGGLAVLAEEVGRSVAALPLIATALAADAIVRSGHAQLHDRWGEALRDGRAVACLALPGTHAGWLDHRATRPATVRSVDGRLHGHVATVAFAAAADVALVAAQDEQLRAGLWLVALDLAEVRRKAIHTIDNARGHATLQLAGAPAVRIGDEAALARLIDEAAVLTAFEQIGGAETALALAREHALQRVAFGQPIARFQAIKHKLVEIYGAIEIARGCALAGLAVLADARTAPARHIAAATARVAATQAHELAAREGINVHGALGVTREAAPHRHYRRSRALALELGSPAVWRDSLVDHFVQVDAVLEAVEDSRTVPIGVASGDADAGQADADLAAYRARAAAWLDEHAPRHSGAARQGLSFEADLALARAWQALKAAHGYAGITLPKAYGGAGGSELQKLAFTELEMRHDLPMLYFSVSLSNPVPILLRHAPEALRLALCPPALRGEQIWCQMFSEPAAGSDLAALRTRAERDGEGWRLNGQKVWTSWAQIADWGVIVARTDPTVAKHAGLTYFFIDMKAPGVTVRPIRRLGGEPDLNEVFLDNVYVPDSQRLGGVGEGFKVAIETLMIERYAVVDESGYAPPLEALVDMARERRIGDAPALDNAELRSALAQGLVERTGLRNIHRRALDAMAAGREPGPEGSLRKLLLGRSRQRIAALAMDLQGPDALALPADARALTNFTAAWLDPSLRIAGGTDEVLLNTLAERVLGLPQDHRPDKGKPFNQLRPEAAA